MSSLFRKLVLLLFTACISRVWAWDISNENDRQNCQSRTRNPLDGCEGSRMVFVDGLGNGTGFRSVQSAVASLPNNTDTYIILIAAGNYTEQVNVTRRGPTYLLGQTSHPKDQSYNTVNIIWAAVAGTGDNAYTSTLTVAPNLNASLTGSGPTGFAVPSDTPFGSVDFRTYNINFINDYAPYSVTPSLALSISRANGGFYYTGFYSYQDTVYVGKLGNAYFKNGEVAGQTDFFYGFGTAWVEKTSIALRSCGGGITAWKGTNTTFANKYGVYIVDSNVHAANSSLSITNGGKQNAQMRAIFARTYLDSSILSTGYIDWVPARYTPNLTLQAEYRNYGPGYNVSGRASALSDVQLTDRQWEGYDEPGKVFQTPEGRFGNTGWIDWSV
ncbi:putative pectinesterase 67 [Lachnellula cervina]|uniref:pectinesterase n=1 Tax=Lachnellula cervina TaxID=1316786 RepID=A0A7D8UM63_9HELO|nr:putative pectinesterase 67 [Lachnellula cervina]